jgi:hypothetical protein
MDLFYEGLIAGVSILGGICAFNYWMFSMMEKRLDLKLDMMNTDIHAIVKELVEERRNKSNLYNFVMENAKK